MNSERSSNNCAPETNKEDGTNNLLVSSPALQLDTAGSELRPKGSSGPAVGCLLRSPPQSTSIFSIRSVTNSLGAAIRGKAARARPTPVLISDLLVKGEVTS
jgi:hypothetical protein